MTSDVSQITHFRTFISFQNNNVSDLRSMEFKADVCNFFQCFEISSPSLISRDGYKLTIS